MAERGMEDWTGEVGDRWLNNIDRFEGMLAGFHAQLAEKVAPTSGETILDVGCGGGPLAIMLARQVGPQGHVTGLDIAPQLVKLARDRAQVLGLANLTFEVGDAGSVTPAGAPFDRFVSAFGVMFFEDSLAAFTHIRSLLQPGARVDFAAWAAPDRNPWMGLVMAVMADHVDLPERNLDDPGPFRFHDASATCSMLTQAGFSNAAAEEVERMQPLGGPGVSIDEAVDFVLNALDMNTLIEEQGADVEAVRADLNAALSPSASEDGVLLPATALFYSATA